MSALKNHGEKIGFGAVVVICGAFVAYELSSQAEPPELTEVKANKERVALKIQAQEVSPGFEYSANKVDQKLKVKDVALKSIDRVRNPLQRPGQYVFYPQPIQPSVGPPPRRDSDVEKHEVAVLGEATDMLAHGDHGRIFVRYKLPTKEELKYMEIVRVEIFRGEAEDKIDLKTPYHVAELAPEDAIAETIETNTGGTPPRAPNPGETPQTSSGERRRLEMLKGENAPKAEDVKVADVKPEATGENLPDEFKALRVFQDTQVRSKQKYFYKLRIIGRMEMPPETAVPEFDKDKQLTKKIIYHAPDNAIPVAPKEGTSKQLFASKFSQTFSATSPSDYEFRLSGVVGTVSPIGTPEPKRNHDYKGKFAVKVWVMDAKEWKTKEIEVGIGEELKGTIDYRSLDTNKVKTYVFNSGYTLDKIEEEEERRFIKEKKPIRDEETGKLLREEEVERELLPPGKNLYAYLKDDKGIEKVKKRPDFEARDLANKYYREIALKQAILDEANRKRIHELVKKNKEQRDLARKNPPAEAPREQPRVPVGPDAGFPGGQGMQPEPPGMRPDMGQDRGPPP
jgi:hypothetical protein